MPKRIGEPAAAVIYSGRMLASLTARSNFFWLSRITSPYSCGVVQRIGRVPSAESFSRTSGLSSAALIAAERRATMSGGIPAGPRMPSCDSNPKPGMISDSEGTSEIGASRLEPLTARSAALPERTIDMQRNVPAEYPFFQFSRDMNHHDVGNVYPVAADCIERQHTACE